MSSRLFRSYLGIQLASIAGFAFVEADGWAHSIWQMFIGWCAAAFVVAGMRTHKPNGPAAWYLFGGGVFLNSTGILVAGIMQRIFNVVQEPMPADAFWLCLYPGLVLGLGLLVRRRTSGRDWSTLVDTVTISTGLGLLSWVFIIRPQAIDPQLHLLARATVAAYPCSDIVVLAMLVRLLIGGGGRNTAVRLIVGSVLGFFASDIGWAVYSNIGVIAPMAVQRVFEICSLMGYVLVGAAAVHPSVAEVTVKAPPRQARLSPFLLGGLTVASLIAPAVLIFEAVRREITDGLAIAVCSAVLFLLVVIRMAQLVRRVELRTRELADRNRSVRRVLDTVNEGLLTVARDGWLAEERSAIIDTWFGAWRGTMRFVDYIRTVDDDFADAFELGFEALLEETLPMELCLAQLPTKVRRGDRQYRVGYLPILDDGRQTALLVVINDVTDQMQLAKHDAEQRELLSMFQAFTRDRGGFLSFFDEANQIIEGAVWSADDRTVQKRLIHTLKGNASLAGLDVIAELCHKAEDELEELPEMKVTPGILALRSRWLNLAEAFRELVGDGRRDVVELQAEDLDRLCEELGHGLTPSAAAERLRAWRCEPVERALERLGDQARALAKQLGKGEVEIDVSSEGGDLRLDPRRWGPLWAEMVHVIRNAVDHGFEGPDERRAAEKPAHPRLRLSASVRGDEFTIDIEDDGRGIDWAAIERAAVARGLPMRDARDRLAALLTAGVSSRTEITEISGRGVGMSAVEARVRAFAGTMEVESHLGAGTRWRFSFPLSSVAQFAAVA